MAEDSSLDRFLRNRAASGLGMAGRRAYALQMTIGAALLALAVIGATVASVFGEPGHVAGAVGMSAAGIVNLIAGSVMKRKVASDPDTDLQLSPEAKALVLRLARKRLGWWNRGPFSFAGLPGAPFPGRRRTSQIIRGIEWSGAGQNTSQAPTEAVQQILEEATQQYNRVHGTLAVSVPQNPTLAKFASSALLAADEVIGDILHHAATMDRFPESAATAAGQISAHISTLSELADRLEEMSSHPSLTQRMGNNNAMDIILEDLRLEQLARSELQAQPEQEDSLQNRLG